MVDYGFEYFCGANVVIEIEDFPILETAGFRVSIMESKRPIYGYSSRHFDAVASGQVLVEGSLLINYVDHNYLFRAIELGLERQGLAIDAPIPPAFDLSSELISQLGNEGNAALLLEQFQQDPVNNQAIAEAMKNYVWGQDFSASIPEPVFSPHDSFPGLSIRVTFGDRQNWNMHRGLTGFQIQNVHFLGRAKQVSISEDVIVEEYPFFARNLVYIRDPRALTFSGGVATLNETGEEEVTISNVTVPSIR